MNYQVMYCPMCGTSLSLGDKIGAIKHIRDHANCGLKDAKDFVDMGFKMVDGSLTRKTVTLTGNEIAALKLAVDTTQEFGYDMRDRLVAAIVNARPYTP